MKQYGPDHIAVATSLNNIGAIQKKLKNNEEAVANYEKSMAIFKKHYDEKHPIIGTCHSNLGSLKEDMCEYEDAIQCFLKAEKVFTQPGQKQETVASIYFSMGRCYDNLEKYEKAEEYYNQSLKLARSLGRMESNDSARIYKALADIYKNRKDVEKAYEYYG